MQARRRHSVSLTLRTLREQTTRESWSQSYQLRVERAYRHMTAYFRDAPLADITANDVYHYLGHRVTADHASPSTAASELAILKSSLRKSTALDDLPHLVVKRLLSLQPPQGHHSPRQPRFLTVENVSALLLHAPVWLQGPIVTMIFAGLRPSEIVGLRWVALNEDRQELRISTPKIRHVGNNRKVPLPRLLSVLFRELRASSTHPSHIFVDGKGNLLTLRIVATAFRHASQEAGLAGLRLSDVRATFAHWACMAGMSPWTVSRIMGVQMSSATIMFAHWEAPITTDVFELSEASQSNSFLTLANRLVTDHQQHDAFLLSLFSRLSSGSEPAE